LVWGGAILALAPKFIWWMLPVVTGMILAVPFTVLTSRASLGRALRARGWLVTPEEHAPPPELAALTEAGRPQAPVPAAVPAPAVEIWVRVPQPAPLAMASSEPTRVELTPRAA
jgi:membrane glycosyltransferase